MLGTITELWYLSLYKVTLVFFLLRIHPNNHRRGALSSCTEHACCLPLRPALQTLAEDFFGFHPDSKD